MATLTHTEEVQKLFVAHMGPMRAMIIGMVADLSIAEDILQESFITVTRKADQFEIGTNFLAWARAVVRLKVLELVREQKQQPMLLGEETLDVLLSSFPVNDTADVWAHRQKVLYDCLHKLPLRAHRIITMRYAEGLHPQKIAELISWSVGAVRVHLTRVRSTLAECVRRKISAEAI